MRVKIYVARIDPEEYTMPADENPERNTRKFRGLLSRITWHQIKHMKINME